MGMMCSGAMKRRVAEPLGMLISTPLPTLPPQSISCTYLSNVTIYLSVYLYIEDMMTNVCHNGYILFPIIIMMSDWSN